MLPRESRIQRLKHRARRRTDLTALEVLEERTVLSFSNLGYSLPDLRVTRRSWPKGRLGGKHRRLRIPSEYRGQHHDRANVAGRCDRHTGHRLTVLVGKRRRRQ